VKTIERIVFRAVGLAIVPLPCTMDLSYTGD